MCNVVESGSEAFELYSSVPLIRDYFTELVACPVLDTECY